VNDSIALLEDLHAKSNGVFDMIRGGYAFVTSKNENPYEQHAHLTEQMGIGEARFHNEDTSNYKPSSSLTFDPTLNVCYRILFMMFLASYSHNGLIGDAFEQGIDIIKNPEFIHSLYPFLDEHIVALKHVRKCGWITVSKLIDYQLIEAKKAGATFFNARVKSVNPDAQSGKLKVILEKTDGANSLGQEEEGLFDNVVFAVGPKLTTLKDVIGHPDLKIPLINEIHARVIMDDKYGVVDRFVSDA
jgi:hypothetical protein